MTDGLRADREHLACCDNRVALSEADDQEHLLKSLRYNDELLDD